MKKLLSLTFFLLTFTMLTGCGATEPTIVGDLEESKIIVDETRNVITIHTLIRNTGTKQSEDLFAEFIINDEQLAEELGQTTIPFADDAHQTPTSFTVAGENGYFIGHMFDYEGDIPHDQLRNAVDVVVLNGNQEEVTRYSIERVESN